MPHRLHVSFIPPPVLLGAVVVTASAHAADATPSNDARTGAPTAVLAATPQLPTPILHALGLMTAMRATEAYLWPDPFVPKTRFALGLHYYEAYSRPPLWDSSRPLFEEDGDRWQINVFGHGLFGSELYLRARTCQLQPWQALLFTGLASATWEYGVEASGVRPSALDLTFTPAAGLLLGEGRYQAWRALRQLRSGPWRSVLSALVDPLGDAERAFGAPC